MTNWQWRRVHFYDGDTQKEQWVDFDEDVFVFHIDTCGAGRLEFRQKLKEPDFVPGWYLLINSPTIRWISWESKEGYNLDHWELITKLPETP